MAFFKTALSKIVLDTEAKVNPKVTPSVTPSVKPSVTPNVKEVPQKVHTGHVVEALDKDNFLYFRARAISAGETSGPNGNGDFFPLEELVKSYKTFIGRGLFLNHDALKAESAVGKIIDAYLITDPETREIWVETLCKIDRKANAAIARQVETGIIDSVSMGCNCEAAQCSVCDRQMTSRADFCDHMSSGLLRKYMNKNNEEILCYSINKGLTFSELSLVSVPADGKAKIHEVLASLKKDAALFDELKKYFLQGEHEPEDADNLAKIDNLENLKAHFLESGMLDEKQWTDRLEDFIMQDNPNWQSGSPMKMKKTENLKHANSEEDSKMADEKANVSKVAGEVDSKQPASKIMTTTDEQGRERAYEPGDKVSKAYEKVTHAPSDEQDEVKKVLEKLNALDFLNLQSFISKKAKGGDDMKDIHRHTDKDYEAWQKRNEEVAAATKSSKVDEPALKDMKKDILDRTAEMAMGPQKCMSCGAEAKPMEKPMSGMEKCFSCGADMKKEGEPAAAAPSAAPAPMSPAPASLKTAGKEGVNYGDKVPEKMAGEEELTKMRKEVLRRVQSKLATKLFRHVLEKEVAEVAGDAAKAASLMSAVTSDLIKVAEAKPGSKEYYYWTGKPEPKSAAVSTEAEGELYSSEHAGEDVTTVKPGTQQTEDAKKQLKDGDKKDEWSKATDSKKKSEESANSVEKTKKQMGFSASYVKADKLEDSRWIVKTAAGIPVLDFSLGQAWEEQLAANAGRVVGEAYGKALVEKAMKDGVNALAKIVNATPIEIESASAKDKKVLDMLEKIEDHLGIQEKSEDEEKEHKGKNFHEQVMMELEHIEKAVNKGPKKEDKPAGPKAPEKKDEGKKDEKKPEDKGDKKPEDKKSPFPPAGDKKPMMPPAGGDKKPAMPKSPFASDESPASEIKVKAFDNGEPITLADGVTAHRDLDVKMIVVKAADGNEMGRYPDAFGDDATSITSLLNVVLGLDKKKASEEAASREEKSENEKKLEAELQAERTKSAIREKSLRARAVVEEMLDKDLIQPEDDVVKAAQKEGINAIDSRREGLRKAIDSQMSALFKMDEIAFTAFTKSIKGIRKEASKRNDVLTHAPVMPTDPLQNATNDSEWLRNLPWS